MAAAPSHVRTNFAPRSRLLAPRIATSGRCRQREHFDRSIEALIADPRSRLFVLFDGEEFAGMSAYLSLLDARQTLEIGSTYYRPHLRATGFNGRVKAMMLERAFACGYRRVQFCVDIRNSRSQAAMKKLGAVREGVLRADRITWTGHVRDTVLFAILRDERVAPAK
ncbi:MAG: GNAT family protein [Sphingomicrobium sp.]